MDRELEELIEEWRHIITLVRNDDNEATENSVIHLQISTTQFVRQTEVIVYEGGYTEWPIHLQRKIFREIRNNYVSSDAEVPLITNTRRVTRFIDSDDVWKNQCIARYKGQAHNMINYGYAAGRQYQYIEIDYGWVNECIYLCKDRPCIHICIPTGVAEYIEFMLLDDFDVEDEDFKKLIACNHHELLLHMLRLCKNCGNTLNCNCPPETIYKSYVLPPSQPLPPSSQSPSDESANNFELDEQLSEIVPEDFDDW